jgi:ribulose-phosphate 3-epimerase
MVLLMSVNPGFGGQAFIPEVIQKIKTLRKMIDEKGLKVEIEIDGGVNEITGKLCIDAGATVLVAGSAIYNEKDRAKAIAILRG